MINSIVVFGEKEILAKLANSVDDFASDNWKTNCFGVNMFAYYTDEEITKDERDLLKTKYEYITGDKLHDYYTNEYNVVVKNWAERTGLKNKLFDDLGVEISLHRDSATLNKLGLFAASHYSLTHDSDHPQSPEILVSADYDFKTLPDLVTIADILENDYKKHKGERKTVGGGLHEVNPINASNIVYTNRDCNILIGHAHALEQFLKLDTFKQVLYNIALIQNTVMKLPDDLLTLIATHLDVDLRYLEEF